MARLIDRMAYVAETSSLLLGVGLFALAACNHITPPNQTLQEEGESTTDPSDTGWSDDVDEDDWSEDDWSEEEETGSPLDLPSGCPPGCADYSILDLEPARLLADPGRGRLYVTVAGAAPEYGNRLVIIDPIAEAVTDSLFVGSNPSSMAISDDGSTLWIGLDGSYEIVRVDLTSDPPTPGPEYLLPPAGFFGDLARAGPMVVLPGTVDSVAISLHHSGLSPSFAGVVILDDGVPREVQTPGHTGASRLVGGPPGWLFGFNNRSTGYGFYAIEVLDTGPVQTEHKSLVSGFSTDIVHSAGRVYATSGQIVDVSEPSTPKPEGAFPHTGAVLVQPELQRVLMLSPAGFNHPRAQLRHLDPETFTQIDVVDYDIDSEILRDFTTADGEILAVIGSDLWGPPRLLLIPNPY